MSRRNWKPEEIERLRGLIDEGISSGQIAKALGRSKASISLKAHFLGLRFKWSKKWTAEQDAALRTCVAAGGGYAAAIEATGRSEAAVAWRIRKLGLRVDEDARRERVIDALRNGPNRPGPRKGSKIANAHLSARVAGYRAWWASLPEDERAERLARMAAGMAKVDRAAAGRKTTERRLADIPGPFRDEYRQLRRKGLHSAEARKALAPKIAAWRSSFEGQLWRVRTGQARIVPNIKVSRIPAGDRSLTGSGLAF